MSLEAAWCAAGLGAECLHLDAAAAYAGDLRRLLDPFTTPLDGAEPGPAGGRALLRLDPSVDAPTLAAVLRRAGWAVAPGAEEARVWSASRGPAGDLAEGLAKRSSPLARSDEGACRCK
ncbi:MAG: hypothetical protein KF878_32190 [Planctomycetes bacterium]|nr:hypothetical protein [Planctomycetota bacterium]